MHSTRRERFGSPLGTRISGLSPLMCDPGMTWRQPACSSTGTCYVMYRQLASTWSENSGCPSLFSILSDRLPQAASQAGADSGEIGSTRKACSMKSLLTGEQIAQYHRDGFVAIREYFPRDEMDLLLEIARADREFIDGAVVKKDREGRTSRLSIRHYLARDIYGALSRSKRIVEPLEQLMGCEIYHYHHKMILKEPLVGGAWDWHQDFGYWYSSFLYPDMASCMIAVDRATRENGCLQMLKGSHRMGRLDHSKSGTQTGAELERVQVAVDQLELVYCELDPGSVLFFHCNLLHRSDPNESEDPRWSLICCYSAAHNRPVSPEVAGQYEKLETLDEARSERSRSNIEVRS